MAPNDQTVTLYTRLLQPPPTTNLPERVTSFVGWARVVEEVKALLGEHRSAVRVACSRLPA